MKAAVQPVAITAIHPAGVQPSLRRSSTAHSTGRGPCRLCGLLADGPARVCPSCADRLESELQRDEMLACPRCSRHQELCAVLPCHDVPAAPPARPGPTRVGVAWLPVERLDAPLPALNSRHHYPPQPLAELAQSIRTHGILQPLCVRPAGERYLVVFGLRRLQAARLAGLREVPCTIQVLDDRQAFLLNLVENLHRQHLSGAERVQAIERLAATGLGVREISRRTGFAPSTISRWLRIDRCPPVKAALEAGTLDIARAKLLAEAPPAALPDLLPQAPRLSSAELRARVAAVRARTSGVQADGDEEHCVQEVVRLLQAVHEVSRPEMLRPLHAQVVRLSRAGVSGDSARDTIA